MVTHDYAEFIAAKHRRAPATGFESGELPAALFDWQAKIVRWATRRGRAAIFADCGLGKTAMQLAWADQIARHTSGRVLILTPLAVSAQTVAEAEKFGVAGVSVCRDHTQAMGEGVRIAVANYEKLGHFDPEDFAGVVLDESSILKAHDGKTRNQIISSFAETPFRLACTATPAPNDQTEMGNHAEFLGTMTRSEMLAMFFVHDGGKTQDWRLKGHAQSAFWEWVCSWACVVTSPSDIGADSTGFDLPPITYQTHTITAGKPQRGMLFHSGEGMGLQERRAARRDSLEGRVQAVADLVAAEPDEHWLIWCDLNAESSALAKSIPGAVEVYGSMSAEAKESALEAFSSGQTRVLVSKPSIAGFGLNWQHCARVVFCGLSDSYESFYQATRRCWRFGQERPVRVHIVISDAEQPIADNISRKQSDALTLMSEVSARTRAHVTRELSGVPMMKSMEGLRGECSGEGWTMRNGDCIQEIASIPDESIGYSVFSPPFSSLYVYSDAPEDMGNCQGSDEFLEHFAFLAPEMMRVMKPGRLLSMHCMLLPTSKAMHGYIGLQDFRGDLIRVFQRAGWIFHSEVVVWKDPVTAMQRTKALGLLHKQLKKDSCMSRQGIPDYVVTMRKPGDNPDRVSHTADSFPVSEWQHYASPVWTDIDPSDTLQASSARDHDDERHICPLQLEVIRRCLRLWSREGDTVLSPFAGIGSEGFESIKAGRKFIGIELKPSYFDQACKNLRRAEHESRQRTLFGCVGGET